MIIEITETVALEELDQSVNFVDTLNELGCRVAIDDFGAGYTSFKNLKRLNVDMVKIDGAFVQHIMQSEDDCAFVRTLIELAKRLNVPESDVAAEDPTQFFLAPGVTMPWRSCIAGSPR